MSEELNVDFAMADNGLSVEEKLEKARLNLEKIQKKLVPVRAKIKPLIDFVNEAKGYQGGFFFKLRKKIAYKLNYKGIKQSVEKALSERDSIMQENKSLYEEEKSAKELIQNLEYLHYREICN